MTSEPSVVEVTLESDLKNLEVAEEMVRRVAGTAGFGEESAHQIEMAVHESMINAIRHGNKNDPSKRVWLRFEIYKDRLEIRVRDQGNGFNIAEVPDPCSAENLLKVSGRGIFLIRSFMDEFHVKYFPGSGTEVTLVKRIDAARQPKQGGADREHESHNSTS
jgi:serine/threonine-protein kinase RsbW